MPTALDSELATYEQHKARLLATAEGKFVLIHRAQVLGVFDSDKEAISRGYELLGNVPFLVKKINAVDEPLTFHSYLLDL